MPHTHAHAHDHSGHAHTHGEPSMASAIALRTAFFINLAFTIFEAVGGWYTNSIAVITDALHDAGDCLVLGAAWWLQRVAMKGRDDRYSYGYGRYSMLGGWLTALVLIAGALGMLFFSIPRLWATELPNTQGMIGIAIFGLAMNGFAAWKLHGGETLNERGAYLHLLEDVLGWAAVLVGAVIMYFTGLAFIDPLLSIGISLFILYNAFGTLRKGTAILMQAQPHRIHAVELEAELKQIPGVAELHDQHTWTLDGSFMIHTVHIVLGDVDATRASEIKILARNKLKALGIHHATIELEWPGEQCSMEEYTGENA
ncbi:MAG: cation transporter [Flavobacteriales bacterium]|nr:cation transporter [Flavobacteriales bacterium]